MTTLPGGFMLSEKRGVAMPDNPAKQMIVCPKCHCLVDEQKAPCQSIVKCNYYGDTGSKSWVKK